MYSLKKINIRELCYYIFIFLILLYYAFRKSVIDYTLFDVSLYLSIPFLVAKVMLEKYTLKESIKILILTVLGCICVFVSGETSILIAFCVVIGMKNVDYKVVLKLVFWIRLFTTVILVVLALNGKIQNVVLTRSSGISISRNALGYTHPNTFGIYCFILISLWFILYGHRRWGYKVVVSLIIGLWQYRMTQSRTAILLIMLFLALVLVSKLKNMEKYIKKGAGYGIVAGAVISFIIPKLINIPIIGKINIFLNSRISLSESYLRVYGVRLFGSHISMSLSSGNYWFLDSGYLNLFIRFGLLVGIIYVALFISMCRKLDFDNIYIYIAAIVFAMYGLVENILASFLYCYLWVLMGAAFYAKSVRQPQTGDD